MALPTLTLLRPGPFWSGLEEFRDTAEATLAPLQPGAVGTLLSHQGLFRLMHDSDFQQLLGLVREARRLREELAPVALAAHTVQQNPLDHSALKTLSEAAMELGNRVVLATRQGHEPFSLEASDLDLSNDPQLADEIETDPRKVQCPLG